MAVVLKRRRRMGGLRRSRKYDARTAPDCVRKLDSCSVSWYVVRGAGGNALSFEATSFNAAEAFCCVSAVRLRALAASMAFRMRKWRRSASAEGAATDGCCGCCATIFLQWSHTVFASLRASPRSPFSSPSSAVAAGSDGVSVSFSRVARARRYLALMFEGSADRAADAASIAAPHSFFIIRTCAMLECSKAYFSPPTRNGAFSSFSWALHVSAASAKRDNASSNLFSLKAQFPFSFKDSILETGDTAGAFSSFSSGVGGLGFCVSVSFCAFSLPFSSTGFNTVCFAGADAVGGFGCWGLGGSSLFVLSRAFAWVFVFSCALFAVLLIRSLTLASASSSISGSSHSSSILIFQKSFVWGFLLLMSAMNLRTSSCASSSSFFVGALFFLAKRGSSFESLARMAACSSG
mmetsp:Transcript_27046/g.53063  ORF Transcript_27046/g.53063 Transcript_27046/m.53063 type:complete len:407 (-) Transcript_27046:396-1616(-)